MKSFSLIVLVLCGLSTSCTRINEPDPPKKGVRTIEPQLTEERTWVPCQSVPRPGHVVADARCGDFPLRAQTRVQPHCAAEIRDHHKALVLLVDSLPCIDEVIAALQKFAGRDSKIETDVAAAFYVRAQREDRAEDLLPAFEAATRAVAAAPDSAAARFNLALIEEALAMKSDAAASWRRLLELAPAAGWQREAREHLATLQADLIRPPSLAWERARSQLPAALDANDTARIRDLIGPYAWSARQLLEEKLLTDWACSPSPVMLERARRLAAELSRQSGDRYALALVEAIDRAQSSPEQVRALRQGYQEFGRARSYYAAFEYGKAAAMAEQAGSWLAVGGSPLAWTATILRAGVSEPATALAMLGDARREAEARKIRRLVALSLHAEGTVLVNAGRYTEALDRFDAALAEDLRLHDAEHAVMVENYRADAFKNLGEAEQGWRFALQVLRREQTVVDTKARNRLFGNAAMMALDLGAPEAALRYQDQDVHEMQRALVAVAPENAILLESARTNVAIALRARANIEFLAKRPKEAQADIDEVGHLETTVSSEPVRRSIHARLEEQSGEAALRGNDPNTAIAAFDRAIKLSDPGEYRSFHALLFAKRAEAYRRAGRKKEAATDLRNAAAEISAEQQKIFANGEPQGLDDLWSRYFLSFEDTYQALIRQLVEDGCDKEAFQYAERSRAYEPLRLALQRKRVARSIGDVESLGRAGISAALPAGTVLLEYSVLPDQTIVWIVSSAGIRMVRLAAGLAQVKQWTSALHEAAREHDDVAFDASLVPPYVALVRKPLEEISKVQAPDAPLRLVFIPDTPMYGLPFNALHDAGKKARYLIEQAPVSTAPSAALYVAALRRDRALARDDDRSIAIIADPAFRTGRSLTEHLHRLVHAREEPAAIAPLYARADIISEAAATPEAFLRIARDKTVVHFAGHAIAVARPPSQSLLLLAPDGGGPGELSASTLVRRLELDRTRLVILSACSSVGGLPIGPEGVGPLVRPLIGAGVPAIIATLWDVDDATAKELLVSFHRNHHDKADAAVALQQAQIAMIHNSKESARLPRMWAPFQLIGSTATPLSAASDERKRSHELHSPDSFQRSDHLCAESGRDGSNRSAPRRPRQSSRFERHISPSAQTAAARTRRGLHGPVPDARPGDRSVRLRRATAVHRSRLARSGRGGRGRVADLRFRSLPTQEQ